MLTRGATVLPKGWVAFQSPCQRSCRRLSIATRASLASGAPPLVVGIACKRMRMSNRETRFRLSGQLPVDFNPHPVSE